MNHEAYSREDYFDSWEHFVNPEKLKSNLLKIAVYISAYELLKDAVIELPRGFLGLAEIIDNDKNESDDYKQKLRSLHPKDLFHASCLWFQDMRAVSSSDLEKISEIRKHRNELTHELNNYLMSVRYEVDLNLLRDIAEILGKIERWWIREIELAVDERYDNVDVYSIPDSEIQGGRSFSLELISKVVNGRENDLEGIYQELKKHRELISQDQDAK